MTNFDGLDLRTPWKIHDTGSAFVVRDASGRGIAHFCYRRELALRAEYASPEEAKAFAVAFAKLSKDDGQTDRTRHHPARTRSTRDVSGCASEEGVGGVVLDPHRGEWLGPPEVKCLSVFESAMKFESFR